jgi:L-seryl-tRNA(Ser) seleniumtransferase
VGLSDAELARRLRTGTPAVMARVRDGKVVFDLRSVFPQQEAAIIDAVSKAAVPA